MFYKDQGNRILSHLSKSLEMSYTMPTNIEVVKIFLLLNTGRIKKKNSQFVVIEKTFSLPLGI